MTNGQMEESIKKEAVLPDTDPTTFVRLMEYAYKGLCGISQGCPDSDPESFLPKRFRCHTCSQTNPRYGSSFGVRQYPFCSPGCRLSHGSSQNHIVACNYPDILGGCGHLNLHKVYCVVDGSKFFVGHADGYQLRCKTCIELGRGADFPPYKAKPYDGTEMITDCGINFSLREYACSDLSHEELQGHIQRHASRGNTGKHTDSSLLQHAKLYVLATKYITAELPDICLHKLHAQLLAFKISDDSIEELIQLIIYTYENTLCDGDIATGTGDKLRDLVIRYIVDRAENLMPYGDFRRRAMLAAGSEPSNDFMALMYA